MKKIFKYLNILLGLVFIFIVTKIFFNDENDYSLILTMHKPYILLGAFLLYNFSHFLRSIRLCILANSEKLSFRNTLRLQYYTNGINLALPFKIGEFYRIAAFNKYIKDPFNSVLIIIAERILDFVLIFSFLLLILLSLNLFQTFSFVFVVSVLFLFTILIVFFILPENIISLKSFFIRKYNRKIINNFIYLMDRLHVFIVSIKKLYLKRLFTFIFLTLFIWICEFGVFYILYGHLPINYIILLSILVFLSFLLPSGPAGYGGLQIAFYLVSTFIHFENFIEASVVYSASTFIPAIFITGILFIYNNIKEKKLWFKTR